MVAKRLLLRRSISPATIEDVIEGRLVGASSTVDYLWQYSEETWEHGDMRPSDLTTLANLIVVLLSSHLVK